MSQDFDPSRSEYTMQVIGSRGEAVFNLHRQFHTHLLRPVGEYVNWKLAHEWDDYNELYHAIKYIERIKKQEGVWFETHTMEKNKILTGVLLIVGGRLTQFEDIVTYPQDKTLILKYFHIVDKGKGYGTYWLKEIILPFYANREYEYLLVSSSHPKSFNFYRKTGQEIRSTLKKSDNGIYDRTVKLFSIPIKPS